MIREVEEFLETQRIGVLAVLMPDGSPHGATLHFAHTGEQPVFIFHTKPTYRKAEALREGASKATFVVGVDEANMKTLQMDGEVALADNEELRRAYFAKFTEKAEKPSEGIFFTFTPTWWRFTDWTLPQGKTIFSSEDTI